MKQLVSIFILANLLIGCDTKSVRLPLTGPLFELVDTSQSGIFFVNRIQENEQFNYYKYIYLYNGGGTAIGDLDNDGLPEVIFVSNTEGLKLYHNNGGMSFTDVTIKAGINNQHSWHTGITLADVNGDGLLDIYVCRSGLMKTKNRANLLYINNGDLTFSERAQQYRINDAGFSSNANFFDYDKDGDLDLLVTNHPITFPKKQQNSISEDLLPTAYETDHLFRCDGNQYTNVTAESGITNRAFGLSSTVADLNNDGWLDIYTSNDFIEPDYLYYNNGDGTFKESIRKATKQISYYSMGVDIADINNDGRLDIFTTDMVSEDHYREKLMMGSMSEKLFNEALKKDKHYQYMYNALQLNRGQSQFSNIAAFGNVSKTDWSWSPLIIDLDNDGFKDIIITNGILRDVLDSDFRFKITKKTNKKPGEKVRTNPIEALNLYKSTRLKNYIFKNNGDLTFSNKIEDWGWGQTTFSNGMSYGDLDADGDIDIVINNINGFASIYRNRSNEGNKNWIQFELNGDNRNTAGLGTRITIYTESGTQINEITSSRGYLSSSQTISHFGINNETNVDKVVITWASGLQQELIDLEVNQRYILEEKHSNSNNIIKKQTTTPSYNVGFRHKEDSYNDMDTESLIPYKLSKSGPFTCVADVNNDGLEDFFVGGASNQSGELYIQGNQGSFTKVSNQPWEKNKSSHDQETVFLDIDGDDDMDLYVVSGGSKNTNNLQLNQDRLYLNNGNGNFREAILPEINANGSCVAFADFDADGDLDAFIGGRSICQQYPYPDKSFLLINNNGRLEDKTKELAPDLQKIGMVNSVVWSDIDNDGDKDLLVVGEWMPITIFINDNGRLHKGSDKFSLKGSNGWWYKILATDIDGDGDDDYLVGNLGLNHKYEASYDHPFHVDAGDIDGNGTNDIILSYAHNQEYYPVRGRNCTSKQIPKILSTVPTYSQFASSNIDQLFGTNLCRGKRFLTHMFASILIKNNGGKFEIIELPNEAQLSPINSIIVKDLNNDGEPEIIFAGNIHDFEAETPRLDAGIGSIFHYRHDEFILDNSKHSDLMADGNVKSLSSIKIDNQDALIIGNNNGKLQFYLY